MAHGALDTRWFKHSGQNPYDPNRGDDAELANPNETHTPHTHHTHNPLEERTDQVEKTVTLLKGAVAFVDAELTAVEKQTTDAERVTHSLTHTRGVPVPKSKWRDHAKSPYALTEAQLRKRRPRCTWGATLQGRIDSITSKVTHTADEVDGMAIRMRALQDTMRRLDAALRAMYAKTNIHYPGNRHVADLEDLEEPRCDPLPRGSYATSPILPDHQRAMGEQLNRATLNTETMATALHLIKHHLRAHSSALLCHVEYLHAVTLIGPGSASDTGKRATPYESASDTCTAPHTRRGPNPYRDHPCTYTTHTEARRPRYAV
jgi:hypothetical protein